MKILISLLLLMSILSCNCKKNITDNTTSNSKNENKEILKTTMCPDNGVCTTKLLKNKSLEVKTDEFGSIYYTISDNQDQSVILFTYNRNVPKGLQDAHYREEIVFEINNSDKSLALNNNDLQKTKMLYGRFCFCRGQTGRVAVIDGQLNLKKIDDKIDFNLTFKNNKFPQLLSTIAEIVE